MSIELTFEQRIFNSNTKINIYREMDQFQFILRHVKS
jgi:hypothetical protein